MVRKGSLWAFLVCARGCASGIVCRAVPYRGAIVAETSKHNAAEPPVQTVFAQLVHAAERVLGGQISMLIKVGPESAHYRKCRSSG